MLPEALGPEEPGQAARRSAEGLAGAVTGPLCLSRPRPDLAGRRWCQAEAHLHVPGLCSAGVHEAHGLADGDGRSPAGFLSPSPSPIHEAIKGTGLASSVYCHSAARELLGPSGPPFLISRKGVRHSGKTVTCQMPQGSLDATLPHEFPEGSSWQRSRMAKATCWKLGCSGNLCTLTPTRAQV